MDQERLNYLLAQYEQENCSEEEYAELDTWFHALNYKNVSFSDWIKEEGGEEKLTGRLYDDFKTKVETAGKEAAIKEVPSKPVRFKPFYKITAAAAILLIVGAGLYFYNLRYSRFVLLNSVQDLNAYNDITPGKNTAILTLANGKKITLSSAKAGVIVNQSALTYNDGTAIGSQLHNNPEVASSQNASRNDAELSTPRGGQYQVILPDQTKVWLNAASTIKFPATFTGLDERKVELSGEAYFIVKHNNKQPFKVITKGQVVEDIGTEFNINAYADETVVKTTLIEGSAKVIALAASAIAPATSAIAPATSTSRQAGTQYPGRVAAKYPPSEGAGGGVTTNVTLTPNLQSILTNNKIQVQTADTKEATAWKDGDFQFNEEKMSSIVKKLERWYDVEIIISDRLANIKFTGKIARSRNISRVLSMMEETNRIHFKIEGRRITAIEK